VRAHFRVIRISNRPDLPHDGRAAGEPGRTCSTRESSASRSPPAAAASRNGLDSLPASPPGAPAPAGPPTGLVGIRRFAQRRHAVLSATNSVAEAVADRSECSATTPSIASI